MMRFVAQRRKGICGPVTIINLRKFFGMKASYKADLHRLIQACKTANNITQPENYATALKEEFPNKTIAHYPQATIDLIDEALEANKAVIVRHITAKGGTHYLLIWKMDDQGYWYANSKRVASGVMTRNSILIRIDRTPCPIWIIDRLDY